MEGEGFIMSSWLRNAMIFCLQARDPGEPVGIIQPESEGLGIDRPCAQDPGAAKPKNQEEEGRCQLKQSKFAIFPPFGSSQAIRMERCPPALVAFLFTQNLVSENLSVSETAGGSWHSLWQTCIQVPSFGKR